MNTDFALDNAPPIQALYSPKNPFGGRQRISKTVEAVDGAYHPVSSYPSVLHWEHQQFPAPSCIEDLHQVYSAIAQEGGCVVMGLVFRDQPSIYRRVGGQHGETRCVADAPRPDQDFDFDGLPLPADIDLQDGEGIARYARSQLPEEYHEADVAWRLTSSHTIKEGHCARLRLSVLMDRLVSNAEMRGFVGWVNADIAQRSGEPYRAIVDAALYNPVQPHYVAAPTFVNCTDPVACRSGVLKGSSRRVAFVARMAHTAGLGGAEGYGGGLPTWRWRERASRGS